MPTDAPAIVPPSHSAQPMLQPTDIHRHVCPASHTELPLRQAQGKSPCGCHTSGDLPPCQAGRLLSIALRGLGEMRLLCDDAVVARASREPARFIVCRVSALQWLLKSTNKRQC